METKQLEEYIREHDEFDEKIIDENKPSDLCELLGELLEKHGITRAELIMRLNFDRSYGYQLLNGTRAPSRIHLIKIGIVMQLELDEVQSLLRAGRKEMLYARNITDARAIYAIEHKLEYDEACEFIWTTENAGTRK